MSSQTDDLQDRNRGIVRRYLAAFNAGDLDAFDALVDDRYVNHSPSLPDPAPGPEGLKPIGREPACQMQIERLRDGKIVEHWRVTA